MPFQIVRNDITRMQVDAIVTPADPQPTVSGGADAMIHRAAGKQLSLARHRIGILAPGTAALTPAFELQAKYVIHAVGPVWQGGDRDEAALLRSCYDRALQLAAQYRCRSVAFPLIATGHFGFPKDLALQIAMDAFSSFLMERELQIYLVVFDTESYRLSEKLFADVASFLDEHYVQKVSYAQKRRVRPSAEMLETCAREARMLPFESAAPSDGLTLENLLKQQDAGFTENLLLRIDRSGKKDSQIYKKANLSRQHFSKIRNNPAYQPTKATAVALAIALELDLEQTRDLIGRAGYALTNSSKFDLIVRYFIQQGIYNVVQINMALYEFDQTLLGG